MSEQGLKSKFKIGQMVDLVTPTVLIVGVHFHGQGPGGGTKTTYDVLEGQQIHQGVTEEAIAGLNELETARVKREWAEREEAMKNARPMNADGSPMQQAPSKLSLAVSDGIATGAGSQDAIAEERRQAQPEGGYQGEERRLSELQDRADQKFDCEVAEGREAMAGDDINGQ